MGMPEHAAAFADCARILDGALRSNKTGVRVTLGSVNEARQLRNRLYAARRRARDDSMKMFSPGEPGYNTSPWDGLMISMSNNTIDVVKLSETALNIQEI